MTYQRIAEIPVSPQHGSVYEEGWQSWSPTDRYKVTAYSGYRYTTHKELRGRPGKQKAGRGFQGEGLLLVDTGLVDQTVHVFSLIDFTQVPSIRAECQGSSVIVSSDGLVSHQEYTRQVPQEALGTWAKSAKLRKPPTVWCSWYQFFEGVTQQDIARNTKAIFRKELPVDIIQIDDGWQAGPGDWLSLSERFVSLPSLVQQANMHGMGAGIWVAPFLAGSDSKLAADHPDWLVPGAGENWAQELYGLDLTNTDVLDYIREVFEFLRESGFTYYKLDFLYAGLLNTTDLVSLLAYRNALKLIRDVVGKDAYILGCGAPIFPSVGLVDAMRIASDIRMDRMPLNTLRARYWQQGRFWVNDADCLLARPAFKKRMEWASYLNCYSGLRSFSDEVDSLDKDGLFLVKSVLKDAPEPVPF